jgi:flagellar hook-basal body complex protein FliE
MNPPVQAVEAIGGLAPMATSQPSQPSVQAEPATQFGQWFVREVEAVNTQMVNAERSVQQLAAGGSANLHETMLQLEQARLSFQLAIQVRSRILDAYQEVMRMQV